MDARGLAPGAAQKLTGGAAKVLGSDGDGDELWGDLGHDTLIGGAGADRFCVAAGNAVIVFSDTDSITLSGIRREQVGADWFITA